MLCGVGTEPWTLSRAVYSAKLTAFASIVTLLHDLFCLTAPLLGARVGRIDDYLCVTIERLKDKNQHSNSQSIRPANLHSFTVHSVNTSFLSFLFMLSTSRPWAFRGE